MTRDEAYIARRSDADWVEAVEINDRGDFCLSIMAAYGSGKKSSGKMFVHQEPLPLRPRWAERAIAHFLSEKERA